MGAIANGTAPGCKPTKFPHFTTTAESPPCVRLTMTGNVTQVPAANRETALKHLFNRHPEMKSWNSNSSEYVPFWMAPNDIDEFFLIPFYGGSVHFTAANFLAARWYKGGPQPRPAPTPAPSPSTIKYSCDKCGHVYDAETDGAGMAFEDLPADWLCPVCGVKKSHYHPISF